MSDREAFLRGFHAVHAGATSRAFARTGSYARLAARVSGRERVLDLACGDHPLPGAIGVDLSLEELARAVASTRASSSGASRTRGPSSGASSSGASSSGASRSGASSSASSSGASSSGAPSSASISGASISGASISGASISGASSAGVASAPPVRCVQARAQALPFSDGAFDACVCHLAFMLFDDLERVVAELRRVLVPGGVFVALLGGGPVELADEHARDRDAFHRFLAIARPHLRAVPAGDPRARSEHGWRALFAGWSEPVFERVELELGGTFEDAWDFVGASYQLDPAKADEVRAALRAELAERGEQVSCKVACWIASVTRR